MFRGKWEKQGEKRGKKGRRCFMLTACRANCHRTELIVVLVVVVLAQKVKDELQKGGGKEEKAAEKEG